MLQTREKLPQCPSTRSTNFANEQPQSTDLECYDKIFSEYIGRGLDEDFLEVLGQDRISRVLLKKKQDEADEVFDTQASPVAV